MPVEFFEIKVDKWFTLTDIKIALSIGVQMFKPK